MLGTVAIFAGTDIDDLIVLTVLFLAGRATGRPRVVERFGRWLVPVVFIVIGLILIARPIGTFARFA